MNPSTPIIIADSISDLTLARYFASRVSDYLVVDLDRRNLAQNKEFIAQLQLWVEGPEVILTGSDNEVISALSNDLQDLMLCYPREDFYDETGKIKDEIADILLAKKGRDEYSAPKTSIHYAAGTRHDDIPADCPMIVIRAVPESRTGIYDFGMLEDFFDAVTPAG